MITSEDIGNAKPYMVCGFNVEIKKIDNKKKLEKDKQGNKRINMIYALKKQIYLYDNHFVLSEEQTSTTHINLFILFTRLFCRTKMFLNFQNKLEVTYYYIHIICF